MASCQRPCILQYTCKHHMLEAILKDCTIQRVEQTGKLFELEIQLLNSVARSCRNPEIQIFKFVKQRSSFRSRQALTIEPGPEPLPLKRQLCDRGSGIWLGHGNTTAQTAMQVKSLSWKILCLENTIHWTVRPKGA